MSDTRRRDEIIEALEPSLAILYQAEDVRPLAQYILDLRAAAADEAEKRCIRIMCKECASGNFPVYWRTGPLVHQLGEYPKNWRACLSKKLYEMRRERNEGGA